MMKLGSVLKSVLALGATCLVLVARPGTAAADGAPAVLSGGLTTHQVACATLCTQGVLTGGLAGQLDFVMGSMTPTADPNVFLYVGTNIITTAAGTLAGVDHGIWNIATGEFVDYTKFSTETGAYAGNQGAFTITGVFDPVAGQGHSNYFALLFR